MSIAIRILSGVFGLTILAGTVVLALNLLGMRFGAEVLLAGYMGIGGLLVGAFLLVYAITGNRQSKLTARKP